MKKICKGILILFLVFIAMIVLTFLASPIINDIAADNYKKEVLGNLNLPENTVLVEAVNGCGNTSGTGNHNEIYVSILLKTTLPDSEVGQFFPYVHKVSSDGARTLSMMLLNLSFSDLDNIKSNTEGYYIVEYIRDSPCSDFDLRGH